MRRGAVGRVLLGMLLVQLVLPAAWAFSLHGLALRPGHIASAVFARAPALPYAAAPRARGAAALTQLAAKAGSLTRAVDPENGVEGWETEMYYQ